jgi:hypothetical protein
MSWHWSNWEHQDVRRFLNRLEAYDEANCSRAWSGLDAPRPALLRQNFDALSRMRNQCKQCVLKSTESHQVQNPIQGFGRRVATNDPVRHMRFAVLRALMLESELVLEVMHHFIYQDG